jgi:type IV pilus assembly protein PilE
MKKQLGFTLVELMIVVAVVAILAGLAFNTYRGYVQRSKRTEAKQILADYAMREEKWRASHSTYTNAIVADLGGATTAPSGNYTFAITFPSTGTCPGTGAQNKASANSFIITATKAGTQADDNACATMVFTNDCGTITKTSTGGGTCW